ncbi:MAG: hypothetical protein NVSMB25_26270 [Thermoleophilaceae bacterium]
MSEIAIFMVGLAVTLAVGGALVVLIWACIQDGRTQRAVEATDASEPEPGLPLAAKTPAAVS